MGHPKYAQTVAAGYFAPAHWRDYQYGAETAPEEDYQDDYDQVRTVRREVPQNQYYYQWTLCATASWIATYGGNPEEEVSLWRSIGAVYCPKFTQGKSAVYSVGERMVSR
eukprot:GHVU01033225.1.p1 GENE.GHVU01033225.1~~GHVU01033225.1.p1  ORF type:complete len:117 (-),score=3.31 GHVU01033225.1:958-1287(-)